MLLVISEERSKSCVLQATCLFRTCATQEKLYFSLCVPDASVICGFAKNGKTRCERGPRLFSGRMAEHIVHESGMMVPGFDNINLESLSLPVPPVPEACFFWQVLSSQSQEMADGHVIKMVLTNPDNSRGCTLLPPWFFFIGIPDV